jgi:hypothetical protein
VLHAFGADQLFGDGLDRFGFTFHYENLKAVIVIEVHMQR